MPSKLAIVLVVVIFLITLLVRLPASVLAALLPRELHCQEPSGTVWQGACAEIHAGQITLSDLHWRLQPLALLRAQLRLELQSSDAHAAGRGTLTLHPNGDLDIESLTAWLPLRGGITALPADWDGGLELAIAHASVAGHRLASIEGTVTARQLRSEHPAADLGSFELRFPPAIAGAESIGALRDIGGPLALQGVVQLAPGGAYELNGTVAARETSNGELQQLLQLLGPPDAQGRHEFSLSGSY
jgi:general secretion pathway protein N